MLFKTPDIRDDWQRGDVDARIVLVCYALDSRIGELTAQTPFHVQQITLTSLVRARDYQRALNLTHGRDPEFRSRHEIHESADGRGCLAADIRIRDWPKATPKAAADWVNAFFRGLVEAILEKDHMHVETVGSSFEGSIDWGKLSGGSNAIA